jgi:hypothetical protein
MPRSSACRDRPRAVGERRRALCDGLVVCTIRARESRLLGAIDLRTRLRGEQQVSPRREGMRGVLSPPRRCDGRLGRKAFDGEIGVDDVARLSVAAPREVGDPLARQTLRPVEHAESDRALGSMRGAGDGNLESHLRGPDVFRCLARRGCLDANSHVSAHRLRVTASRIHLDGTSSHRIARLLERGPGRPRRTHEVDAESGFGLSEREPG